MPQLKRKHKNVLKTNVSIILQHEQIILPSIIPQLYRTAFFIEYPRATDYVLLLIYSFIKHFSYAIMFTDCVQ